MHNARLPIPRYLVEADINDPRIRYTWDQWKDLPELEYVDPELAEMLEQMSERAELAFACATTEWILYRFEGLADTAIPWSYLEAAWALTVNVRYCGYGPRHWWQNYSETEDWTGPVKGVISEALNRFEMACQQLYFEGVDPVTDTSLIATLALHVIPKSEPYRRWSQYVLRRLIQLYPRDPNDKFGDVVPREATDPDSSFDPATTESLVNRFLASLSPEASIFLSPPGAMLEPDDAGESFKGVPYVFDIEADRKARREFRNSGGRL